MRTIIFFIVASCLLLFSCNSKPTLQKYFVDHQEKPGFMVVDISSNILNVDKAKLTAEQSKALSSFSKMNILAYKLDPKNKGEFNAERTKVNEILKDTMNYQQLMRVGSGKNGASISFMGDEDRVDEFIIYGSKSDNGFAVVRIMGNDMNPADALTMLSVLKKANIDVKQLEPLKGLMK